MKVIDRYVLGSLLLSFIICLVGVVCLYILIDGFERLEDFKDYYSSMKQVKSDSGVHGAGRSLLGLIFHYYLIRVPVIYVQVAPVIMLLASMFTMTRMVRHNELIPLHASGISLYRVMVPHFALAVLCAGSMVGVQELVIPKLSRKLNQAKVLTAGHTQVLKSVQTFDSSGRVIFFGWIFPFETEYFQVRVLERYPGSGRRSAEIYAQSGRWQRVGDKLLLVLSDGVVRRFSPDRLSFLPGYPRRFGKSGYVVVTDFKLSTLYEEQKADVEMFMRAAELRRRIKHNPQRNDLRLSLHLRFAMPLGALVLLMLGTPLVIRRETRNVFLGVSICILVAASYYISYFVTINLGNKMVLSPQFAAWAPLILFGALGLAILDGVRT